MKHQQNFYDVAIVGGGMVGTTLACALGGTPLRVALIEAMVPRLKWPQAGFDLRVSAITRATQCIFESLDVWPKIMAQRVSPFRSMHVWDATGTGVIHFDSADLGEGLLGHIIENRIILAALHERLSEHENVELLCPTKLKHLQMHADQITLELESGDPINTSLLVGADGSHSWVRDQADISVRGWDYDQSALVTHVKTALAHQETAWQRFMPDGPLAFLPLTQGYSSIVWSTTPTYAEELKSMDELDFRAELRFAFEDTLGEIHSLGERATFPLHFAHAETYVRPRIALLGDAAHTIHPLAGQGVNLGMADVATLAEVLQDALVAHQDIGSMAVLRRYERWRKAENQTMLAAADGFKRLFGSELSTLRWARNMGMELLYKLPPIKNLIMRYAMGLAGDLPKLARGSLTLT